MSYLCLAKIALSLKEYWPIFTWKISYDSYDLVNCKIGLPTSRSISNWGVYNIIRIFTYFVQSTAELYDGNNFLTLVCIVLSEFGLKPCNLTLYLTKNKILF